MPSICSICYESFTAPVSLPCGHVFCRECIRRTVDSIKSCSVQHWCPTCRVPYSVVTLDPALIPPYLRPHIQPAIRPLFLNGDSHPSTTKNSESTSSPVDTSMTSPTPPPASSSPQSDLGRAQAELTALRLSCATWRRRAEVHAAANAGLLGFARATKDAAARMRGERDDARKRYELLSMKHKLLHSEETDVVARIPPSPPTSPSDSEHENEPVHARPSHASGASRLPTYLRSRRQSPSSLSDNGNEESSCFGPPLKRCKRSTSPAPSSFMEPPFPGIHIAGVDSDIDGDVSRGLSTMMPVSDVRSSGVGAGGISLGRLISSTS